MTARLVALCVDANDPLGLARFWAEALRWEIDGETEEGVDLVPTDGTSFGIVFHRVPEPKVGRNRIHLDLTTTSLEDQQESVSTLVALGARHIDVGQTAADPHVVLADPEGNELCLIEPQNSFLAGCGRLGALSCDGSRQVGCFWRDALGWPLVWDEGEETAVRSPDGTGPFLTWGGGPEIPKVGKNRLHLHIAPVDGSDQAAEVDRLVSLGATRAAAVDGRDEWVVLLDPDGNEVCLLER
jgi:catechol 2,3-dioxygenase-like lactoylglutathione lyase family enzyme